MVTKTRIATKTATKVVNKDKTMGVDAAVVRLSPADAQRLLEKNSVNRNLRRGVVDAYRRDMEQGRWGMTGEPLQLSRTDLLLNGQHRMTALAEADVDGIDFLVVTGLDDKVQSLMDQGATRGIVDALRMSHGGHIKNITVVSGVSRWLVAHPQPGVGNMIQDLKKKVSSAEAVQAFNDNPDIEEACDRAVSLRANGAGIPGSATGLGYAYLHISRVDPAACNEFFGAMSDMSFSMKDDPRKAALRRLTQIVQDREGRGADRAAAVMAISVLTRAWNAWRRGEEMPSIMARNNKGLPIDPVQPI